MDRTQCCSWIIVLSISLNPYSNGIWIERFIISFYNYGEWVLILILMEYG